MNDICTISENIEIIISIVISLIVIKHFSKRRYPPFFKYHTFWPRFWSPTIDGVILWPLVTLLPLGLYYGLKISQTYSWLISTFICLIQFTYSIYMNGRFGGSVGKLKCKIRILDSKTENPISYRQAFLRDSVPLVLILAICIYSMTSFSKIE